MNPIDCISYFCFQVALTVYWLGKTAKKVWDGPQLDFTAFSDLVHRTGVSSPHNSSILDDSFTEEESVDNTHLRQESADSGDKSSAYGSLPSKTSAEEVGLKNMPKISLICIVQSIRSF